MPRKTGETNNFNIKDVFQVMNRKLLMIQIKLREMNQTVQNENELQFLNQIEVINVDPRK
jgi:hypothetical protein